MNECMFCQAPTEDILCEACHAAGPPRWEPELELIEDGDEWKYTEEDDECETESPKGAGES